MPVTQGSIDISFYYYYHRVRMEEENKGSIYYVQAIAEEVHEKPVEEWG